MKKALCVVVKHAQCQIKTAKARTLLLLFQWFTSLVISDSGRA